MAKTIKRERQTVAALVDNDRVPAHVRHWLERYIAGDEHALEHTVVPQLDSTMEQVQLVYDVLDAQSQETGEHEFPEAARDFIEEYLYQLSEATGIRVWSDPDTAIAALPTMLQMTEDEGDTSPSLIALKMAIRSLTTTRERRYFLKQAASEPYDETEADRHYKAAMKAARILADPRTSFEVRDELENVMMLRRRRRIYF